MRCRGKASLTVAVVVLAVCVGMGISGPAAAASAAPGEAASSVPRTGPPQAPAVVAAPGGVAWDLFGQSSGERTGIEDVKQVRTSVVLRVRPAADVPARRCEFGFQVSGHYNKPDFTAVMREEGIATAVSSCGPDLVSTIRVDATIDDFGMPGAGGHQIATGSNQGTAPGPVVATVAQDVTLVEAPPPDNYRIEWIFRLHAVSVDGQQATACAKLQAVFPDNVRPTSC